jgi:hypothetical protein
MKFWLPLILGTIAVSAFLTYLNLYKGAQTLAVPAAPPAAVPGKLEFGGEAVSINGKQAAVNLVANVVELDAGIAYVGDTTNVGITLKNSGEGALELAMDDFGGCDCATYYFNDKEITKTDPRVTIPPGKSGVLRVAFKPQIKHVTEQFRNRASFNHNDPRFNDKIHIEIISRVKPRL